MSSSRQIFPLSLSWPSKVAGLRVGDGFTRAAGKESEGAERREEKGREEKRTQMKGER